VASKDGMINSNYGWAVFSKENGEQFNNAIKALKDSKYSRQASLIYNRPSMHTDAKKDGMHDFMCTYATQFIIRDGLLCHFVYMRSNDAIFGYRGDWAWQNFVHDLALDEVKKQYPEVEKGPMMWNAASLHVYPRHFDLVRNYVHNL
jgi:thymidylate synthase